MRHERSSGAQPHTDAGPRMALGKAMTSVVIDLTMSLDGFVAGPSDGPKHPLGMQGESLFDWYQGGEVMRGDKRFAPQGRDRDVVEMMFEAYGAFVTGRRTYDITNAWDGTHPLAVSYTHLRAHETDSYLV